MPSATASRKAARAFGRQGREALERGIGQRAGVRDIGGRGVVKGDLALRAGRRVDGEEGCAALALARADKDGSVEHGENSENGINAERGSMPKGDQ